MNRPITPRRFWLAAAAAFAAAAGGLAWFTISTDRAATIGSVQDNTHTISRLLLAHAEAALEDANKVLKTIGPRVDAWDPADAREGERLTAVLKDMIAGSPQVTSAWVLDAQGRTILNNWSYPPDQIDGSQRPNFLAHLAGDPDPVIIGDGHSGPVTGKERFTFSRALRRADGSLKAVISVGIYNQYFGNLYAEVATRPGARAGLYRTDGTALGSMASRVPASRMFLSTLSNAATGARSGTRQMDETDGPRIVSWQRSETFPGIFASSSQPVDVALADWTRRSWMIGVITAACLLACLGLVFFNVRAAEQRHKLRMAELLNREVHHRVKNSLHLISSLLNLRANRAGDAAVAAALRDGARQVSTISSVHELLQASPSLEKVDLCRLLNALCNQLGHDGVAIVPNVRDELLVDASQASTVGIMANELITNALKHALTSVAVTCEQRDGDFVLLVADDGPGLPDDFDIRATGRFGLLTVKRLSAFLGGTLAWGGGVQGAQFVLRIPTRALVEPAPV